MVRIITDSAADFEPRELEKLNISCTPLSVAFGEQAYQENINLSKNQFYDLLLHTRHLPKSSQPAPQLLLDLFENTEEQGDEAIFISLSSALSGTYQSAVATQAMADSPRCHVVDSLNATGGERLLVEYAVQLRDSGASASEIIEKVTALRSRVVLYACIDTLEYLYKGGRISHTSYKLGTLANIKPVINIDSEGRVVIPAKAMGIRKGMDYLCKRLEAVAPDSDFPLYVLYTSNRTVAETLAARLEAIGYTVPADRIIQVGAAIGSHIGPDACGLVYIKKEN